MKPQNQVVSQLEKWSSKVKLDSIVEGENLLEKIAGDIIKENEVVMREKYMFPATIEKAQYHEDAVKFGYTAPERGLKRTVCACCGISVRKQEIQLCHDTTDINRQDGEFKLNSGVVMFFSFVKMLIIYLLMRVIVVDGFNVITNISFGNKCELENSLGDHLCAKSFFTLTSAYNKINREDMIDVLDILNLITIVLSIIFFLIYRKRQYEIYDSIDTNQQTQDDYSILIENIPILDLPADAEEITIDYRKKLKEILEDKIRTWLEDFENWDEDTGVIEFEFKQLMKNLNKQPETQIVTSISLCYDLDAFEKFPKFRQQLMDQHEKLMQNEQFELNESSLDRAVGKLAYLNQTELGLCEKYSKDNSFVFNLTHFVSCAFVSFQYQHYREYILRELARDKYFLMYNLTNLQAQESSHPRDVNWSNLKVKKYERYTKTLTSYLILFMVLTFAFGTLIGNDIIKTNNIYESEDEQISSLIKNYALTFLATIFTLIINYGLQLLIIKLTTYQKHKTKTHENFSLVVKLLITQFINTALIYFILSKIIPKPVLSTAGIVLQVSSLIVVSGFIQILTNAAHIGALMRSVLLWWKYSNVEEDQPIRKFQVRLNKEFQHVEFNMAERYSYYLLQVYTASFYSYLAPVGVIALVVIFFCQYWIDKYNLFTRSSLFVKFNYSLSRNVLVLFEGSILVFACGNVIFSMMHHHSKLPIINIVGLAIAGFYVLLTIFVPNHIKRKIYNNYETLEVYNYQSCISDGKFDSTYWSQNPAVKFIKEENVSLGRAYVNPALQVNVAGVIQQFL